MLKSLTEISCFHLQGYFHVLFLIILMQGAWKNSKHVYSTTAFLETNHLCIKTNGSWYLHNGQSHTSL